MVVRVECESLHAVGVSRFVYDCLYFSEKVQAMTEAITCSGKKPEAAALDTSYRTIIEVR